MEGRRISARRDARTGEESGAEDTEGELEGLASVRPPPISTPELWGPAWDQAFLCKFAPRTMQEAMLSQQREGGKKQKKKQGNL